MSDLQRLIKREVEAKEPIKIVTVIGDLRMLDMSPSNTAPIWVTDVEFGGGRPLKNVPVKSLNGSMFYAQRGQTVQLRRSSLGRWQIVGPGDRLNTTLVTKEYSLSTGNQAGADINSGFSFVKRALEFYGGTSMKGNPDVTFVVTGGDDYIQRASGSWITDGFEIGDTIVVSRSMDNDGTYTVTDVAALQLDVSTALTDEGPVSNVGVGVSTTSFWNNGGAFPGFPEVSLVDADGNLA